MPLNIIATLLKVDVEDLVSSAVYRTRAKTAAEWEGISMSGTAKFMDKKLVEFIPTYEQPVTHQYLCCLMAPALNVNAEAKQI